MTQHGVSMAQYYEEFKLSIKIVNLEITGGRSSVAKSSNLSLSDESLFQVDAASIMLEKHRSTLGVSLYFWFAIGARIDSI